MRIQLLLADQEVELTKNVSIPLNKSFENLTNPTDIIVDYSKTISIPMTIVNNKILGNAYRLDKTVLEKYGQENIGMYLDPTKKIPFRLLYNGEEIMDGYAKFTSANYSKSNKSYNLNLFGVLGEYFQKMKDVIVSSDKLTDAQKAEEDGGKKYILNDHIGGTALDADYVYNSWMNINNNPNDFTDDTITDQDIIGFAPAYRGYYGMDFKSSEIQVNDNTIMSLSQLLANEWKETYSQKMYSTKYDNLNDSQKQYVDNYVDKLGADEVIGDGLKDYQMNEYRAYHQRPFIYINKLIYMFKEKSKELTGFDLLLDENWFNKYNPFWTKLVYTLNYLEDIDEIPAAKQEIYAASTQYRLNPYPINDNWGGGITHFSIIPNAGSISFTSIISNKLQYDNRTTRYKPRYLDVSEGFAFIYKVTLTNKTNPNANPIVQDYWSTRSFVYYNPDPTKYTEENRIFTFTNENDYNNQYTDVIEISFNGLLLDKMIYIPNEYKDDEWDIAIESNFYTQAQSPFRICMNESYINTPNEWVNAENKYMSGFLETSFFNHKEHAQVGLNLLYLEENPIFDIVLQYTKMFGLVWDVDKINKTIKISRKSTYFKDYSIEDWTNKLDRSKDFILEPVTFESKYVNFNYEDVDGDKYTAYKDKYGVAYGMKKLKTTYDFDSDDKDLFSKINPSMVSQRQYIQYSDLKSWDLSSTILPITDQIPRIEAVDTDDSSCINASSWYFRLGNKELDEQVYITNDSELMKNNKKPCWYTKELMDEYYYDQDRLDLVRKTLDIPQFHVVVDPLTRPLGCLFNCPKEDYTIDKYISNANGNYIYDIIWRDFIDERYNVQNKKLTAYFDIYPHEYMNFKFNKFVILDNQLFMVNKIFDYDLNSTETTKCELVQVSDINNYTKDSFKFDSSNSSPEIYTLTIIPTPSNATVMINNKVTSKYTASKGASLNYSVSASGYKTVNGTIVLNQNETMSVILEKDVAQTYQLQLYPIPSDAKVVMNGIETNILSVPAWTEITYTVSLDGYQTATDTVLMDNNYIRNITLIKEDVETVTLTINTNPSDASIKIDTTYVESGKPYTTARGTTLWYTIMRQDYVTIYNSITVDEDTVLNIDLVKKNEGEYTFTIIPTPSNATVHMYKRGDNVVEGENEITNIGTTSMSGTGGDTISWSVSCDGYETRAGSYIFGESIEREIVLEKTDIPDTPSYEIAIDSAVYDSYTKDVIYDLTVDGDNVYIGTIMVALSSDIEGTNIIATQIVDTDVTASGTFSGRIDNSEGGVPYLLLYCDDVLCDARRISGI